MKYSTILFLVALTAGCTQARLDVRHQRPTPVGKLECGVQRLLTVWQDLNNNQVYDSNELTGAIVPFAGTAPARINYGYSNYSAHPAAGPQGEDQALTAFFYAGPEGLSFNFFFDRESSYTHKNHVEVAVTVSNNGHKDQVILSDEPGEFLDVDADPVATFYRGIFDYMLTTDGGIIGPLIDRSFQLEFSTLKQGNLDLLRVASARGPSVENRFNIARSLDFMVKFADVDPCAIAGGK